YCITISIYMMYIVKLCYTLFPYTTLFRSIINSLLIFSVAGLSIWLWMQGSVTAGAIAAAVGLVLRLYGMSQWMKWEMSESRSTRDRKSTRLNSSHVKTQHALFCLKKNIHV